MTTVGDAWSVASQGAVNQYHEVVVLERGEDRISVWLPRDRDLDLVVQHAAVMRADSDRASGADTERATRKSQSPPRPVLDLARDYTFYINHDLRRFQLRPWWATGAQGVGSFSEAVWHARTREDLEAKLTRFARRDMLRRGVLGEPQIRFEDR